MTHPASASAEGEMGIRIGAGLADFSVIGDIPGADEVRDQLNRIVRSAVFRGSLRLTRFINFVVEAALAGQAGQIKAYTIAVEALGRGSDFDPQVDPIVRVQAVRLRAALAHYYRAAGSHDELVIELPRGRYVPTFRYRRSFGWGEAGQLVRPADGPSAAPRSDLADLTRQLSDCLADFQDRDARSFVAALRRLVDVCNVISSLVDTAGRAALDGDPLHHHADRAPNPAA